MSTTEESIYDLVYPGLHHAYIGRVAEKIRAGLGAGATVEIDYQPGDMTRYELVFVPLRAAYLVGDLPAIQGVDRETAILVVCANKPWGGAYPINLLGRHPKDYIHHSYVREHLVDNAASAVALALLLEAIAGVQSIVPERSDG